MMKKKILFIMPSMFIGGAERSLIGLLDSFDYEKYDVSLFLFRHEGEFLEYIPKNVNILPPLPAYGTFDVPIKGLLFSNKCLFGISRIFGKLRLKFHQMRYKDEGGVWAAMQYISRSIQWLLPKIPGKYDVAISFLGIPDTLINKVNANTKLAWNHTDYMILGPDKKYDRKLYAKLEYIVSVSEPCREQFLKVYPEMGNKAIVIENLLSVPLLKRQAEEPVKDMIRKDKEIILLSVGRFSDAKNFDNVPFICKQIRDRGINVKWYLLGYGTDENIIRQRIDEAGMQEHVIIIGKRSNPYAYISKCDIYIQPSRYEGKCVSVIEAQILNKPVIITNYATSASQLENGVDGVIVPMDNEGCAEGIISVINNRKLLKQLEENTNKKDYSNVQELEKLYCILDE